MRTTAPTAPFMLTVVLLAHVHGGVVDSGRPGTWKPSGFKPSSSIYLL